jgi:hypothetical protein
MIDNAKDGYMMDGKGRLVPVDMIKDLDKARDGFVCELIGKVKELNSIMVDFKAEVMDDIGAFVDLSAEQYGAHLGGIKGNVQLSSFDGRYRIKLVMAETVSFDERLQAAKKLVDECITEWAEGSKNEIKVLVTDAFDVDKEGNICTWKVLSLRRYKINDDRWKRAMDAISESLHTVSVKPYIRFYEKNAAGQMVQISLDVATV